MSSRSNRSKQLKQMEDAVLGLGGGGGGVGIGGAASSSGLGGLDIGSLGGAGGGVGGLGGGIGGVTPAKKSNVDALADLEREVKLSIGSGADGDDPGGPKKSSSSSSKKKKKANELEKSLAEGLSIADPSKVPKSPPPAASPAGSSRFIDDTIGVADSLDARDLDEEYEGPGARRGYGSYTGRVGDRCGDCLTWIGRHKRNVGLVSLIAVAIGISVGGAVAAQKNKGGEGAPAAATVKGVTVQSETAVPEETGEEQDLQAASEEITTPSTLWPAGASREEMIAARILSLGVTDPGDLEEPDPEYDEEITPQLQAVKWLANEDPMKVDPSDPYLPHRYALVTFWYSTYEDARTYDEANPPSQDDEEYANWDVQENWMSEKGICLWYGVTCWPNAEHDDRFDGNHQVISLNLTGNNVRGYIPDEMWTVLTDMRHLDLSDNILTGDLSPEIKNMIHMEDLRLGTNELTGTIPPEIGEMVRLKDLYLESNWMEGPLPVEIGKLTNLRHLGLYKNYFNGTIPYDFDTLHTLQSLYLDINEISGEIPDYLFYKLPSLMDLRLGQNALTGPIPEVPPSESPPPLKILYLDHNELTGDIPESISTLSHLDDLHLYKNILTGPLPTAIGTLKDLDRLFLDHNMLEGPIPPEWSNLDDLEELYLYSNDLTGTLSGEVLLGMTNLRHFKVGDNSFYGKIPPELSDMYKLEHLWLEDNVFDGTLPDMGDLHKLESLLIHDNHLTGTVSEATCDLLQYYALEELSADCAAGEEPGAPPPEIECECCTSCPVAEAEVSV